MSKFKVGDRVRRINVCHPTGRGLEVGQIGMIIAMRGDNRFCIEGEDAELAHDPDNLELVTASPVRTVERKEIVPGKYGRVSVDAAQGGKACIKINRLELWSDFSASELRAAAATFIELAAALDEAA